MRRTLRVCTKPGCPELVEAGRCPEHRTEADRARGTAGQRGYGSSQWRQARRTVLDRDPACVCTDPQHGHGPACGKPSTVADHHPATRRELLDLGVPDPDAPTRLRGLCATCHGKHTAATTPGGWNNRSYQ